jgi:hypothetical protein
MHKLAKHCPCIFLSQVTTGFDLHVLPQVGQRKEWQHDGDVTILIDDQVLDLADTGDTNELVHDGDLIDDVFEQILVLDLLLTHVLQAPDAAHVLLIAQTSDANHA